MPSLTRWLKLLRRPRTPRELSRLGVLGMNARNHQFVQTLNPRDRYPLVDNKWLTKLALERWGIPTPRQIAHLTCQADLRHLEKLTRNVRGFAVKPCKGAGGKGILVITGRKNEDFVGANGRAVSLARLRGHIANTLSGMHSLTGRKDAALLEELVVFSEALDRYTYQGVPDIRVLVYRGYPAFAMARLPTSEANGKANLHQGAVGVGIDLATGCALNACQHNRALRRHPDTGVDLLSLKVPEWQPALEMATRCWEMCGLGYLGADIVLDANQGPMVLELNARPGLSIQIANGCGLRHRLAAIDALPHDPTPRPKERVRLARQLAAQA